MNKKSLSELLDRIISIDQQIDHQWTTEKFLFKESTIISCEQLGRVLSEEQVANAWERWKTERGLGAPINNIEVTLWKKG